jgi:hypothetical protein
MWFTESGTGNQAGRITLHSVNHTMRPAERITESRSSAAWIRTRIRFRSTACSLRCCVRTTSLPAPDGAIWFGVSRGVRAHDELEGTARQPAPLGVRLALASLWEGLSRDECLADDSWGG